jgi:hypothetical protein
MILSYNPFRIGVQKSKFSKQKELFFGAIYSSSDFILISSVLHVQECTFVRGADKSLARTGRKQATATEDFGFRISYL